MITVMVNGCFDILHVGHIRMLEFAKRQGDYLVVAIDSDSAVRRQKGPSRPVNTIDDRMEVLRALRCVDSVFKFQQFSVQHAIEKLKPDVIVKGSDYEHVQFPERGYILRHGIKLIFFPRTEHSTTRTLERL